jgi:DNA-binding FadR family transcriptional regulator
MERGMTDDARPRIASTNMKRPRLAEMVAADLRAQIVSGQLDGGSLPTIDRVMQLFGVSAPAVREAFRILEHEGLITVRRGHLGGAIVHRPSAEAAAYTLGIVLQSKGTPTSDVATALMNLEPLCVRLAAERPDRETTIVPTLVATNEAMRRALYDGPEYVQLASRFHHQLVTGCGNDSLALVAWSLEWLWYSQPSIRERHERTDGGAADPDLRRQGVAAHDAIIEAIRRGHGHLAEQLLREHIVHPDAYGNDADDAERISATHLRGDVSAKQLGETLRERLGESAG